MFHVVWVDVQVCSMLFGWMCRYVQCCLGGCVGMFNVVWVDV